MSLKTVLTSPIASPPALPQAASENSEAARNGNLRMTGLYAKVGSPLVACQQGGRYTDPTELRRHPMSMSTSVSTVTKTRATALALAALAAFTAPARADVLDDVKAHGAVKCGVTLAAPGFSAEDNSGKRGGFDVDLCKAIAAAALGDDSKIQLV